MKLNKIKIVVPWGKPPGAFRFMYIHTGFLLPLIPHKPLQDWDLEKSHPGFNSLAKAFSLGSRHLHF